jgi:hypothetical protein
MALVTFSQTEEFGPAPKLETRPSTQRLALAYLPGRVYWLHSTWCGWGRNRDEGIVAYRGDAVAANHALAEFARLPPATVKEIHLLPGAGISRSVKGNVMQPCDWEIRWSSFESWRERDNQGMSTEHRATMTIYIDRAAALRPVDPRVQQWINDLDGQRFAVRQHAFQNLESQGDAALPWLQKALGAQGITLEARARIERLLTRLKPIHAARLHLPKGIPVVGVDELLRREARNWRSSDLGKSWDTANKLSALAEFTEESFPLLVEMLNDGREQVRDLAVGAFLRLGGRAAAAVPALKAAAPGMTPESRSALAKALTAVAAAPLPEDAWRRNRERRAEIELFLRLAGSNKWAENPSSSTPPCCR